MTSARIYLEHAQDFPEHYRLLPLPSTTMSQSQQTHGACRCILECRSLLQPHKRRATKEEESGHQRLAFGCCHFLEEAGMVLALGTSEAHGLKEGHCIPDGPMEHEQPASRHSTSHLMSRGRSTLCYHLSPHEQRHVNAVPSPLTS